MSAEALEPFIAALPSHVLLVLDEAYNEYLPVEVRLNTAVAAQAIRTWSSRGRSPRLRSGGLRIGYAHLSRPKPWRT